MSKKNDEKVISERIKNYSQEDKIMVIMVAASALIPIFAVGDGTTVRLARELTESERSIFTGIVLTAEYRSR